MLHVLVLFCFFFWGGGWGGKNIISKKSQCFCLLGEEPDLEQSRPCHDRDHSKGLRLVMIFRHVLVFVRQLNWFRTRLFVFLVVRKPTSKKMTGWMVGFNDFQGQLIFIHVTPGMFRLRYFCLGFLRGYMTTQSKVESSNFGSAQ